MIVDEAKNNNPMATMTESEGPRNLSKVAEVKSAAVTSPVYKPPITMVIPVAESR